MKSAEKRKKIFDIYSSNLSRCTDLFEIIITGGKDGELNISNNGFYACPNCLYIHNGASLDQESINPLTLEDVPPKSLGGKANILTCKKCNNNYGRTLDGELNKDLNIQRFKRGDDSPIESRVDLGFGTFNTELKYNKKLKSWRMFYKKNEFLQSKLSEIQKNWDGFKFNLNVEGGIPSKIILGHLRIAYLKLFEIFGYSYILTNSGMFINQQISSGHWNRNNTIVLSDRIFEEKEGIHIISDRGNWFGFLVVYSLLDKKNKSKVHYGVGLPGPFDYNLEYYKNIKKNEFNSLKFKELPLKKYLDDPKLIFSLFNYLHKSKSPL